MSDPASQQTADQPLRLITLGDVRLAAAGAGPDAAPLFGRGKPAALLTYLALAPRRTASRDQLVDLLWSDVDPERGRAALRQTVWLVRQTLGDGALAGRGSQLALELPLEVDRDAFVAAFETGDAERALTLYAGSFLPELAAPGGIEFDHWADLERQRLHDLHLRALETVARRRLDAHRVADALPVARRLRDADPGRESSWRLLLECLLSAGDRGGLAREADAAVEALAREGEALEPATLALLDRARHVPDARRADEAQTELTAALIGREREFAQLVSAGTLAASRSAALIQVVGDAGLGKSRLLRDAAGRLATLGLRVLYVRATPGERTIPFSFAARLAQAAGTCPGAASVAPATAAILVGLDPALSANFPAARAVLPPPHEAVRLRALALAELVAAVADEQPLALLVDDLHWMDDESFAALELVADRIAGSSVLCVAAGRPAPERTLASAAARTIELQPLTPQQVLELAGSVAAFDHSDWAGPLANELHRASDGIPYLVLDTLDAALDRGLLTLRDQAWDTKDPRALLAFVRAGRALDRRLEQQDAGRRELLGWLAVAGTPLPARVLAGALGGAVTDVEGPLADLAHRRLVTRGGGGWQLAHDLLSDRVCASLSDEQTQRVHVRLGTALAASEAADAGALARAARHLLRGGERRGAVALFRRWAVRARRSGDRRPAYNLAAEFLGDLGGTESPSEMARTLPLRLRLSRPSAMAYGALSAAAAIGAIAWAVLAWLGEPARLAIVEQPIAVGNGGLTPPLVVEVEDHLGHRVEHANLSVVASVVGIADDAPISPVRLQLSATQGVARLAKWAIHEYPGRQPAYLRLRLEAPGLTPAVTDTVMTGGASRLWLEGGRVNGQRLGPDERTVVVSPGQPLTGAVSLRIASGWVQASVLLVGVPTWGDRTSDYFGAYAVLTPARRGQHVVPLDLVAPPRPGRYHVIFAFAAETQPDYVASGTNWLAGRALWHDGNDIADWTEQQVEQAERTGEVTAWWTYARSEKLDSAGAVEIRQGLLRPRPGPSSGAPTWFADLRADVPATAIDVVVR